MGGLAYMTGPPGMPLRAGTSVVDIMGGMFGAIGILAALRERERTGRGKLVKARCSKRTAFLVAQHMAQYALTGKAPPPMPEKRQRLGRLRDLQDRDGGRVFIGITSDNQWRGVLPRNSSVDDLLPTPA